MKLQLTLEDNKELRDYAMNIIKSQIERLIRDELKEATKGLVADTIRKSKHMVEELIYKEMKRYMDRKTMLELMSKAIEKELRVPIIMESQAVANRILDSVYPLPPVETK
jgi:hypothetical protein